MFGIGSTELLVILVVALIVLGPKSLPGIAKTLGKVMGEFRRVTTEFQRTMNFEAAQEEHEKRKKEAEEELFGKDKNKKDVDLSQEKSTQSADTSKTTVDASTAKAAPHTTIDTQVTAVNIEKTSVEKSSVGEEAPVTPDTMATSPLAQAVAQAQAEVATIETEKHSAPLATDKVAAHSTDKKA